ncbi:MAG: caspase family protein [Sterolibacteriaceae bacterium]|uniref:Caspase family protein n=1 Tax=Candidatus Methylophosphatis roskildensis TaxID=2899263 RepID=A0A9D7DYB1_9PROT|nr:caspase family protein [Candidatus Methylophosphatis roskildensis]MBK7237491.1 caspase family protein [Sterolibacteriaceae bacterium]
MSFFGQRVRVAMVCWCLVAGLGGITANSSHAAAPANAPRLVVQSGHGRVTGAGGALAISKDGRLVASASGIGRGGIRIWETATGRLVCTLNPQRAGPVAFSLDGRVLASGGNSASILLWDLAQCGEAREIKLSVQPAHPADYLATMGDGRLLIASGFHLYAAKVFDSAGALTRLSSENETVTVLARSGDARVVLEQANVMANPAVGGLTQNVLLRVRDTASAKAEPLSGYAGSTEPAGNAQTSAARVGAVSPSGRWVVVQTVSGDTLTLYDRTSRRAVKSVSFGAEPEGAGQNASGVARAPDLLGGIQQQMQEGLQRQMKDQMEKSLKGLTPEQRKVIRTQIEAAYAGAANLAPTLLGGAQWIGFSGDEEHVFVWRNSADLNRVSAEKRSFLSLEVRRRADLRLERTVSFESSLSGNALDTMSAESFAQSMDARRLAIMGSASNAGRLAVIDLSTPEPTLRAWSPGVASADAVTWTAEGSLITVTRGMPGFAVSFAGRSHSGGKARAGSGTDEVSPAYPAPSPPTGAGVPGKRWWEGQSIVAAISRWDMASGDVATKTIVNPPSSGSVTVSGDGRVVGYAVDVGGETGIELLDARTFSTISQRALRDRSGKAYAKWPQPPRWFALSPDGSLVMSEWVPAASGSYASGSGERRTTGSRLAAIDPRSGAVLAEDTAPRGAYVFPAKALQFTPDGRAFVISGNREVSVFDLPSGKASTMTRRELPTRSEDFLGVMPGDHGLPILSEGYARLKGANASGPVAGLLLKGQRFGDRFAVANAKGDLVAAATSSLAIEVFPVAQGRAGTPSQILQGHDSAIRAMAFSPDGRFLASSSDNGTTILWDLVRGTWLLKLFTFPDGTWAVIDTAGRFDTNNLEEIEFLHWIVPDDPLHALPLEVFMRDFFEPRLLARTLAGEKLPPVRDLASLNRAQPGVSIVSIEPDRSNPGRVNVTVQAESTTDAKGSRSGVHDLRLFRDGKLVGYTGTGGAALNLDPKANKARVTFKSVRLPSGVGTVQFSAYAFNVDRVKSATARMAYAVKTAAGKAHKGRAYIVAMGVNEYESPAWNLHFAANDARSMARTLSRRISETRAFEEVVELTMLSDAGAPNHATKAHLRAVFAALAGAPADASLLKAVPNGNRLTAATPDDLVIFSFAGHGKGGSDQLFYLFPQDIGKDARQSVNLDKLVSTDELSLWLRDIDAGEMSMVIDACHSAASVEGGGFKPGPMGSRGLGQLAYDKGMRILAASQADNVAVESASLQHGLLTYALVNDGIDGARADFRPTDKRIDLVEWLSFGVQRVPQIQADMDSGRTSINSADGRGATFSASPGKVKAKSATKSQQPRLFDFTRRTESPVIATLH